MQRAGCQVHVALQRFQVLMTRKLLDLFDRQPVRDRVRTERVSQHVGPTAAQSGITQRPARDAGWRTQWGKTGERLESLPLLPTPDAAVAALEETLRGRGYR
jgi:hypothetical protein